MTNFNELIPLNEDWKALIKTSKLVGGFFQLTTSSKSNDQLLSFFFPMATYLIEYDIEHRLREM